MVKVQPSFCRRHRWHQNGIFDVMDYLPTLVWFIGTQSWCIHLLYIHICWDKLDRCCWIFLDLGSFLSINFLRPLSRKHIWLTLLVFSFPLPSFLPFQCCFVIFSGVPPFSCWWLRQQSMCCNFLAGFSFKLVLLLGN